MDPTKKPQPSVSIVVPCYNAEAYVRDTVESAVAQTYRPLEVLCVDDGSTDGSLQVLRELEEEYPDLVRVFVGPNRGAPVARNRGLAEAHGDFVQFLDADDVLAPTKIAHQVALALETSADLVAGAFHRRNPDGSDAARYVGTEDSWVALVWSKMGVTSANLWRRAAVEEAGGWKEGQHSSQEYELMFRMLKGDARVTLDEADLTTKHIREGSISSTSETLARKSYLSLCVEVLEYLRAEGELTPERERQVLDSIFIKVRNLYPLDREAALRYHRRAVPWRYMPNLRGGNTLLFLIAYKLLGLDGAERLRSLRLS